ncbi:MAG: hypothetical protein L0Z55_05485 [Planctomycetes bacterium]|nr:hypothetical protein [Planctomycetota bacterium]
MQSNVRSTSWYDVTREMRRIAKDGRLDELYPEAARGIQRTLDSGGRVLFSYDDEEFYQELDTVEVFLDASTGRACGVRRL